MKRTLFKYSFLHANFYSWRLRYCSSIATVTESCNNKRLAGILFYIFLFHTQICIH